MSARRLRFAGCLSVADAMRVFEKFLDQVVDDVRREIVTDLIVTATEGEPPDIEGTLDWLDARAAAARLAATAEFERMLLCEFGSEYAAASRPN